MAYEFEPDIWSTKLLTKLEAGVKEAELIHYPTMVNTEEVRKAIYYCKKYHADQKRDTGEPYYSHPITVAEMVTSYRFNTDVVIISLLHDIIEDTEVTEEMVESWFGSTIASSVEALNREKSYGKISCEQLINDLFNRKMIDALYVKVFDRLHNLETIGVKPAEKQRKTINETLEEFTISVTYLEVSGIEKALYELLSKIYPPLKRLLIQKMPTDEDNSQLLSQVFQNALYQK